MKIQKNFLRKYDLLFEFIRVIIDYIPGIFLITNFQLNNL